VAFIFPATAQVSFYQALSGSVVVCCSVMLRKIDTPSRQFRADILYKTSSCSGEETKAADYAPIDQIEVVIRTMLLQTSTDVLIARSIYHYRSHICE
jgi:hypothetical protein